MSILSLEFLLLASGVVILYYLLPLNIRWLALFVGSAAFLAFSGWYSIVHLSMVALVMWGGALLLERHKSRWLLAPFLALDLGAMVFLKNAPALSGAGLLLPVGLSYFTFQSAGYLIDVYRGKAEAHKNPLKAWLFIGYFPQLAQGPISTWKELGGQLYSGHPFEPDAFVSGFQLILWGYFKKLVVADRLATTTDALLQGGDLPGWFILGGVILYAIRLYLDFSGGMDVVRGLSRMLGIILPENFRRPFFAQSVAEYWRRWHITLGTWFRSYLLYPLAVSRPGIALGTAASKSLGSKIGMALPGALATILVFLLIGLWHTVQWNAVVFGVYFGLIMAVSMLLEPVWRTMRKILNLPQKGWISFFRLVRTWGLVLIAQYFAFSPHLALSLALLENTFQKWSFAGFSSRLWAVMPPLEWAIAGVGCLIVLLVDLLSERKVDVGEKLASGPVLVRWPILLFLILGIAVFGVYGAGFDSTAFLYTQF